MTNDHTPPPLSSSLSLAADNGLDSLQGLDLIADISADYHAQYAGIFDFLHRFWTQRDEETRDSYHSFHFSKTLPRR